jgi:hypothetical protein
MPLKQIEWIPSKGIGGAYTLGEGACAIVDGTTCHVPRANSGLGCPMVSGVCLMGSSVVGSICAPTASIVAGLGKLGSLPSTLQI